MTQKGGFRRKPPSPVHRRSCEGRNLAPYAVNAGAVARSVVQALSAYALYVYDVPAVSPLIAWLVVLTGPWHVVCGPVFAW